MPPRLMRVPVHGKFHGSGGRVQDQVTIIDLGKQLADLRVARV